MIGQKDMIPEGETPGWKVSNELLAEWRAITNSSRKNDVAEPNRNDAQLWMCLVVKVKSDAVRTILHRNLEC